VLPVGGIKEKILAARRANIQHIILSEENRKDVEEIKSDYLDGITFHYVNQMKDVLKIALTNESVKNPIVLEVTEPQKRRKAVEAN
jgi:ATP-dependent Lon protease